ncbi:phage antirepressor [Sphingomonas gellani]|nr:phage antirepressor [Sphingomonas gellani]
MNAIVPFQFETRPVRIEDRGGQPWFVAADVCAALDIANHRDALARLDDDERGSVVVDTLGGPQSAAAINESGLYALILRSRKAAAKRFRKWVTAEVLPSIRRTGGYGLATAAPNLDDNATLRALLMGRMDRLDGLQPKADALDRLTDARGAINVTEASKVLKMGRDDLFKHMHAIHWIYRQQASGRWQCFSDKERSGLVEQRTTRIPSPNGPDKIGSTVMVTPKGLAKLAEMMGPRA